jgi:LytR cell envelope-related transcriptional attenuator
VSAQFDDRPPESEEDLPPLKDWPPPEILARWEARKEAAHKRRAVRRRMSVLVLVAMLGVAGIVFLLTRGSGSGTKPKAASVGPPPSTVVWAVNTGTQSFAAVVSNPGGLAPVAVVIPDQTLVDIPGGPSTVGEAAAEPGLLVAAAQATLNRRVDHYLLMNDLDLAGLVDRIGPIEVQTDESFVWSGRAFGPGPVRVTGGPVIAYLESGTELDRTSRWESVLTGIFSARPEAQGWSGSLGTTDSAQAVRELLLAAHQAAVLEVPTAPSEGGGLLADPQDVEEFVEGHLGRAASPLVRVVVLSAGGRRGHVLAIATRLATQGFRVVAAQQARAELALTQIVASDESFLPKAAQVQAILGVGSVYVGPESSGVADITIVVGKDFKSV